MQLTFEPARLTGFAILAVAGVTALSVGACSSSHDEKAPATSPAPAAANGKDFVRGLIASVSGNAVQVTETTGTATVDVSPSTKVSENTKAELTDIAAGNCVNVTAPAPAAAPGGAVMAASVQLTPQGGGGKCPQPKTAAAAPGQPGRVIGTVASVDANTIHVTVTDANGNPSQTDVTVNEKTHYVKNSPVTSEAIVQGKCVNARGTKDGGGTLQATVATLGPAQNGQCPQFAGLQKPH